MIFIYRGYFIRLFGWNHYKNLFENFLPSIKYHHRLNLDEQLPLMEPGTKIITTIRQPLSFLHSSYNYFYGKYEDVQSQGSTKFSNWKFIYIEILYNPHIPNIANISGALCTMNLSEPKLNSQCDEGARDLNNIVLSIFGMLGLFHCNIGIENRPVRLQSCWWHCDVGDLQLVTI